MRNERTRLLRKLERLAQSRVNDAVKLAFLNEEGLKEIDGLDLEALKEFKRGEKGAVELKLVDRVRALESLCALLETGGGTDAQALYQALAEGGEEAGWDHE